MKSVQTIFRYEGKDYPGIVYYKPIRSYTMRFAKDGKTILMSVPTLTSNRSLEKYASTLLPKLFKRRKPSDPPIDGDMVYCFGEQVRIEGFSSLEKKKQESYLKNLLLQYVKPRTEAYAEAMGIKHSYKVRIRTMSSRYGVLNKSSDSITFTTSLVHFAPEIIDTVVVHELAHHFVLNHSEDFYKVVFRYCPNYKPLQKKLKGHQYR